MLRKSMIKRVLASHGHASLLGLVPQCKVLHRLHRFMRLRKKLPRLLKISKEHYMTVAMRRVVKKLISKIRRKKRFQHNSEGI